MGLDGVGEGRHRVIGRRRVGDYGGDIRVIAAKADGQAVHRLIEPMAIKSPTNSSS